MPLERKFRSSCALRLYCSNNPRLERLTRKTTSMKTRSATIQIEYKGKKLSVNCIACRKAGADSASQNIDQNADSAEHEISINSVSTDTRTLAPLAMFVALAGEVVDGREFIESAIEKGASAVVIQGAAQIGTEKEGGSEIGGSGAAKSLEELCAKFPNITFVQAESTLAFLQDLARAYRESFNIPVIGVTGSNGKTTTKNLVASVLSRKYKVASTKGNLNNHIGVPLSVLAMEPETEMAVFEAGINHVGEMSLLSSVMKPTDVVITNIGTAHIEFLGSKNVIAEEKAMLAEHSAHDAKLFAPAGEECLEKIKEAVAHKMNRADVAVVPVESEKKEILEILSKLAARQYKYLNASHVMTDVALAAEVGLAHGLSSEEIVEGILSAKLEAGRFDIHAVNDSLAVIDDTYNANPDSVCASLSAARAMFPEEDSALVLVLGSLKEQGDFLKQGYRKILETAAGLDVSEVFLVGIHSDDTASADASVPAPGSVPASASLPRTHYFSSKQLCADILTTFLSERKLKAGKTVVLVKGSRSSKMEDVVREII